MPPKPRVKKPRRKAKRKPMTHAPIGSWDERQVTGEGPYKRKAKRKSEQAFLGENPYGYKTLEEAGAFYKGDPDEPPALDITVDTAKPTTDEWNQKLIPPKEFAEEFYPQESDGKVVVGIVVLSAVFVFGIILGSFVEHKRQPEPKVVTKSETVYRNPPLSYSLAENPWAPQKLPLLPEDIEVIRNP